MIMGGRIMVHLFKKDEVFYKAVLSIALPIAIQSLVQSSLNIIDQLMVGQLGEEAIASIGLATRPFNILFFILLGLTGGTSIFVAQFFGKKDLSKLGEVAGITLFMGMCISVLFTIISLFMPELVMQCFTKDAAVIALGKQYQTIIAFTYIPLLLILLYSSILRSTGQVKLPVIAGFLSVGCNTILNYILIFGKMGLPALGVEGAAMATMIARVIECMTIIFITYRSKLPAAVEIKEMLNINWHSELFKKFKDVTLPLIACNLVYVLGDTMYAVIYGRMGTDEMAAMTIVFPLQGLIIGFFTGLSTAAGVILGNELGANNKEVAFQYAKKFIIQGFVFTSILAMMIAGFSKIYLSLFNVSPVVQSFAWKIVIVVAVFLPVKVVNMVVGEGILRSGGETRFLLMIDSLGLWGIGVPLGFFAAFYLKLPVHWVFTAVTLEEGVRVILCISRTFSGKWLNNLVENI
jgi:putative MATE family efflux protein